MWAAVEQEVMRHFELIFFHGDIGAAWAGIARRSFGVVDAGNVGFELREESQFTGVEPATLAGIAGIEFDALKLDDAHCLAALGTRESLSPTWAKWRWTETLSLLDALDERAGANASGLFSATR